MTGSIRSTLETRADQLDAWDVDLGAIVVAGERRLRRRRVAMAGGLAGVLVVAGGLAAFGGHRHRTGAPPADQNASPLTYAVGSVIHAGDRQVDVGMSVDSFVQLTDVFVFAHDQRVFAAKNGDVHQIGELANATTPLVTGEDGRQVGWWKGPSLSLWPGYPQVHGRPNGIYPDHPGGWAGGSPPAVIATWSNYVWVTDGAGTRVVYHDPPDGPYVGWHIRTTGPSMIQDAAEHSLLVRVGNGMAVVDANLPKDPTTDDGSIDFKKDLLPDAPQVPDVSTGDLAPDTRHWFTAQGGQFTVFASSDGRAEAPEHPGFTDVTPYQWLSGDTIAALGHRSGDPAGAVSVLTCRVSTNACTVALADVGSAADVVVPTGPTTGAR